MSHARTGFANAGWELVGSWATTVGAVHEVWDLWEVENYEAAQADFAAELERNPEFAEWIGRLSEVVESERTRLLTRLLSRRATGVGQGAMAPISSRIRAGGRCCSVMRTPRWASASSIALVMAAGAATMPPSPTPR